MACLGGRCPYEVVTGLKPRLPTRLKEGLPVTAIGIDDYVKSLLEHMTEVYGAIERQTLSRIEEDEAALGGRLSLELQVGDTVLVRREQIGTRTGPTRFHEKVYPNVYVLKTKIAPTTYEVEDLVDKSAPVPFVNPVHAERLVKLDMPELELRASQPRKLEMRLTSTQPWNEYSVERLAIDGRVLLRLTGGEADWYDLTEHEYRWTQ